MTTEVQVEPAFMTRKQLAEWLQVPVQWLANNAHDGPPYYKLGNNTVRYRVDDVEQWLMTRRNG